MEHSFEAGLLLDLDAKALGAHAGGRPGGVRDVDGGNAVAGQQLRSGQLAGGINAARGNNLNQGDECALGEQTA